MREITEEQGDEIISLLAAMVGIEALKMKSKDCKLAKALFVLADSVKENVEERKNAR